ncbi:hypothetical protein CF67_19025 [Candidatus Photodesmus blepharus]|uniref:2-haloalkanoic acid dehalogenase n=1 Tax=Candidatus Photodesmus blepharonis TaxID=1179155 RepID=A0A084CNI8_9GAMM|nr:5-amino-6-(5-phospho-D-ribitylamino)uracil phosphatase YigB [Candidatus Photodesmus blepharus]KEY91367.1 hypothetical protein CF67_19025 [Candidatus Photodesmus blepharus]
MHFYRRLFDVKAMTFDLDDTLYDNRPVMHRLEQEMVSWLYQNHPISASRPIEWWQEIKHKLADQEPLLEHDVTLWLFRQIERGLQQLGYEMKKATKVAESAIEKVSQLRNQFEVPRETHRVMTLLAKKIPLVAITNGNVDVEKIGLAPYFQLVLKAGPDGLAKPYADMFDKARKFLRLDAKQILHIGDHLITDIVGAKQNGFQACWYNDKDRSVKQAKLLPDIEISELKSLLLLNL